MFHAWDAARWRLDDLVNRLVNRDAGLLAVPQERWPSWSQEKGWLILTPFYTTRIDLHGERHHIVIDGHSGQIVSSVPQVTPLAVWLLLVGVLTALIALIWWATSMWGD